MATYTSRLNLTKPSAEEMADISVINSNMDKIDAGVVLKAGDTMTGGLTINGGKLAASLDYVPTSVCNIGTDLNNAVEPGLYWYYASYSNIPFPNAAGSLFVIKYSGNAIMQLAFPNDSNRQARAFARHYYNNWGDWIPLNPYDRTNTLSTTASIPTANAWVDSGLTVQLQGRHFYGFYTTYNSGKLIGFQLRKDNNDYSEYEYVCDTGGRLSSIMPVFYCASSGTFKIWIKRSGTGSNSYIIQDLGMTLT